MSSLNDLYEKLGNEIIIAEKTLNKSYRKCHKLKKSTLSKNEKISLNGKQLTASTCHDSEFGNVKFRFKSKPTIDDPLLESLKNTTISFSNLCELLINYIKTNQLFLDNGSIKCNELLKLLTNSDETNLFTILKNVRQIIV